MTGCIWTVVAATVFAAALQPPAVSPGDIVVRDAWVRESTANRTTSAGYLTIENRSARDVTLTGVAIEGAKRVELHAMSHDAGQSTMTSVGQVRIPAHGSVELAPGGLHAMVFDIATPFERGRTVTMTLTFDDKLIKPYRRSCDHWARRRYGEVTTDRQNRSESRLSPLASRERSERRMAVGGGAPRH